MADDRPDPDQLLAQVQAEEARARRGRLRVFFGASAGVGKTYAMLEAALVAKAAGTDVVVGYVEPHGRRETERMLETLESLPPLPVRYRGMVRQEFDLDAALHGGPRSSWSTSWRTRTWSTASRRRGMPSAGRTSRNSGMPASTSGPRSTSSTSRASTT